MSFSNPLSDFESYLDSISFNQGQSQILEEEALVDYLIMQTRSLARQRLDFSEEMMDVDEETSTQRLHFLEEMMDVDEETTHIHFPWEKSNRPLVRKFSSTDFQIDKDHVHPESKRRRS